ncbi:hypothetical protein [Chryseobacterium taichungense]|uniref:hypothetical protein n=1 Tax=Chryseobacterium taichungense TaxID=295069 RepID=UPI0028B222FA|nr:hypothetical protein [Chryseobacterium taichungense]
MKILQLNKYLIIEPETPVYLTVSESGLFYADPETDKSELIEGKFKFICMGNEFEKDQKATKNDGCVLGQIFCKLGFDAFVGEIEKEGYFWKDHHIEKPHNVGLLHLYPTGDALMDKSLEIAILWKEAESKTFNPSKTRIYEIL